MRKHILKLFFRDLFRNRIFSLINIAGMSIAIACSFLIYLYIINEVSYNKHNENYNRVGRILTTFRVGMDKDFTESSSPYNLGPVLSDEFPEVESATRIFDFTWFAEGTFIRKGDQLIEEDEYILVDPDFFNIFSIRWIQGNIESFQNPKDVILSKSAVQLYFNGESPVGKTLNVKNNEGESVYNIVGVFSDLPNNSTIKADVIGHIDLIENSFVNRSWGLSSVNTFVLLSEREQFESLQNKLITIKEKYHPNSSKSYTLQPMADIYFGSGDLDYYDFESGDKSRLAYIGLVALLVVLIATINYMIMATAKGLGRNMEIGIRKVVGASRKNVINQVLIESFLFVLLIFPFSLMLSELLLPVLNNLVNKNMEIHYFENLPYLTGILGMIFIIGIFSGWYISFYISKFQPESILKAKHTTRKGTSASKQILMLVQLSVFIVLFIFTGFIFKQIQFMLQSDVGYKDENLIIITPPHDHHLYSCAPYVNAISSYPEIFTASEIVCGLYTSTVYMDDFFPDGKMDNAIPFTVFHGDQNMIEAYNLSIMDGRDFNPDFRTDSNTVLINETAANMLGYEKPVGRILGSFDEVQPEIIGLVRDFNISSLHEAIPPIVIKIKEPNRMITQIAIRYHEGANVKGLLKKLEDEWDSSGPDGLFRYYFMSGKLEKLYTEDENFGKLIQLFAILTIIISLLGIYGLSVFSARQRNKEIGIRKAFGANFNSIIQLLTKKFFILVILSNVISWPIAYYITKSWLQNFAYKTDLNIIIFIAAFLISAFFISIIIGYNTYNAANQNPADIIRYE